MKKRLHDGPAEPCEVFGEFGRFPDPSPCHAGIPALQEDDDLRPGENGGKEKEPQDLRWNGIRWEVRVNGEDLTEGIYPANHRDFQVDTVRHPRGSRQEMKETAVPVRTDFLMKGTLPEHHGKARPFAAAGTEFLAAAIRSGENPQVFGFLTVPKNHERGFFRDLGRQKSLTSLFLWFWIVSFVCSWDLWV